MIELRHLRTLMALKESGSLAGAAKKRFVTQSALSHQIKELETRINSSIFVRKSKPLTFTHEGSRLLNLAEEILPKVIATESDLKRGLEGESQQLKLGIECHSCFRWLMPVIEQFKQHAPAAQIDISSRHLFDSLNALQTGSLDIVLTSDPVPGHSVAYQHLFDFEVKLIVASDNTLAAQAFVTPAQLAKQTLISYPVPLARLDIYKHFLEPAGIEPGEQKQCDLTSMLLQRVACNDGIATLPTWSIRESQGLNLTAVKLGAEGLKRPLFGAYRRDATNANLIQKWLELVANEGIILQRVDQ
ncbi:MAG: LysR family transcriptional regulator [Shewanella psychromarinicola]|jgi:LysR family transcriptional regulator for metE and metH|uniref:HTH-type transcriptional regulator MetR n=1 Tax=Shewanella psychromarinicola TaxID=2487742 RepID=A0A3N4DPJ3_9GAMM|nr:LysR family transcriptional regulator [Shewanella psychromarinicola]AZG33478.1 LysR family transcriptional regulator [Shewanella psychromarinicola]MCL1082356.1 LysR family transcriptional regulator [Shewanella psychromarinicola]RPA27829.1 LysR family transcriptional regulator [Shewanella psychromarinicola]|tara:strand:+ start:9903 stop:10808 length:906 start_codon:yes stop_codon:yes gene_type:complete